MIMQVSGFYFSACGGTSAVWDESGGTGLGWRLTANGWESAELKGFEMDWSGRVDSNHRPPGRTKKTAKNPGVSGIAGD
jgi:hypothetical protein